MRKVAALLFFIAAAALSDEVLDNAAVIRLVKAGLGADVVILKVEQSPAQFDVSTSALVDLKTAGVPDSVIKAMLLKAPQPPQVAPPPPKPATDSFPCAKVKYYTLGTNGWDWVPSSLCVSSTNLSVDEENIPLDRVVAHCIAKTSLFIGDTEQEWWFTDGKETRKFRGKEEIIKSISDAVIHNHSASKHGSCNGRPIRALFDHR